MEEKGKGGDKSNKETKGLYAFRMKGEKERGGGG